jgi:hypothetical protein
MTTRFQGYIRDSTLSCLTGSSERIHFGMSFACKLMPTLTYNLAILNNDTAHTRVRISGAQASLCQLQSPRHVLTIANGMWRC